MANPQKKKPRNPSTSNKSTSVSRPSVSTPTVPSQAPSTTPYAQTSENTSSTTGCHPAYICGQQNLELQQRVDDLEARLSRIEETAAEKRSYYKKAESLLIVFKTVLIAIPIVLFIALAVVQYFAYNDSKLLNIVTGTIGLATIAECIALPIVWRSIDSRLTKVEDQLKD